MNRPTVARFALRPRRVACAAAVLAVLVGGLPPTALGADPAASQPCSPAWLHAIDRYRHAEAPVADTPIGAADAPVELAAKEPAASGPAARTAASGTQPSGAAPPNDELYWAGQSNSLPVMRSLDAWETTYGGDDVTVAVIAGGVDVTHPDLDARIWRNGRERPNGLDDDGNGYVDDLNGWDFGEGDDDVAPIDGRGTLLAGIVAAETNNRIGVAAVNWQARVMPLKVFKAYPNPAGGTIVGAYPEDFTQAVCYAANNGARVILFSYFNFLGAQRAAADLERLLVAIDYAYEHGVLTIAPAGDCALAKPWCPDAATYGANPPMYPAVFNNVVGVTGFRPGYTLRDTASHGHWVDIAAPGEGYYTTKVPDVSSKYYYISSNTAVISDFAAAQVAGVVGMMLSVNPDMSLDKVQQTLCDGALKDQGGPYPGGRNDYFGCGLLSAERAVETIPWKMRATPDRVVKLTDGRLPAPSQDFANPYLNAIAWEIRPDVPWLHTLPVTQRAGGPSIATVTTDLDGVPTGILQSGGIHTETLHACTVGSVAPSCQELTYELRFVDRLIRILLPSVLTSP